MGEPKGFIFTQNQCEKVDPWHKTKCSKKQKCSHSFTHFHPRKQGLGGPWDHPSTPRDLLFPVSSGENAWRNVRYFSFFEQIVLIAYSEISAQIGAGLSLAGPFSAKLVPVPAGLQKFSAGSQPNCFSAARIDRLRQYCDINVYPNV